MMKYYDEKGFFTHEEWLLLWQIRNYNANYLKRFNQGRRDNEQEEEEEVR